MNFCDLTILSMSLPNLLGVIILSGKVKQLLKGYLKDHKDHKGALKAWT